MTPKRVKEDRSTGTRLQLKMESSRQREIVGLALFALGGLILLVLLHVTPTALTDRAAQTLRSLFGWGAFGLPLAAFVGSAFLLRRGGRSNDIAWGRIFAGEIFFGSALALLHWFTPTVNGAVLADKGEGGGFVGWAISNGLSSVVGDIPTGVILIALALFTLPAILGLSAGHLYGWSDALARRAEETKRASRITPTRLKSVRPAVSVATVPADDADLDEEEDEEEDVKPVPSGTRPVFGQPPLPMVPEPPRLTHPVLSPRKGTHKRSSLPPLDMLAVSNEAKHSEMDAAEKKRLIIETLADFGVPVQVKEINVGPTVTQFGLEPGFIQRRTSDGQIRKHKVSVSRIAALRHDLELALAASPIRIETPVPGRPIVGIEVPNENREVVALRGVLESATFKKEGGSPKKKKPLKLALGKSVSGEPIAADLANMPHLLIAGATGSGKSVCINAIIACLLFNNSPDDLRLIMVDPKRVELITFNGIPHLLADVIVNVQEVVPALQWVVKEMTSRFDLLNEKRARNIEAYNEQVAKTEGGQTMPYIVVFIDELADLMLTDPDATEGQLTRLAQMARATGIHLVIATQRPSVDVVTGLIKANFPSRISFAVTSGVDSRVVLDTPGAESLSGSGDMLYMASDSSKLERVQGCFVSDGELQQLVKFWRTRPIEELSDIVRTSNWQREDSPEAGGKNGGDELIDKATQLIRHSDSASISFLQRKLGIGYPRAARLMDQLEELGIVGPDQGGGKAREVLPPPEPGPAHPKKKK